MSTQRPADSEKPVVETKSGLAVEMAGTDVIPESERKGKPSDLFMPWFAANVSVLGISWGAFVLGFGISFWQAVIASVIGIVASFLLVGLIAIAGKRGSAPTLVLSRAAFGYNGNRVSAVISWILTVGWETFLCVMATLAAATVMGALGFTNHTLAQIVALIVVVLAAGGAGVLGFDTLMKAQTWITWIAAVLTVVYLALVIPRIDLDVIMALPAGSATAVIGSFVMVRYTDGRRSRRLYIPPPRAAPMSAATSTVAVAKPGSTPVPARISPPGPTIFALQTNRRDPKVPA